MPPDLILASGSSTRADMLRRAGLSIETVVPRVDEQAIRAALEAEGASPRDIADALAEAKAVKVARRVAEGGPLVLGCDQILACNGRIFAKPDSATDARNHLRALSGHTHVLLSAAVVHDAQGPVWRHVGMVRMHMRPLSDGWIDAYVDRNWDSIRHCVGCYRIEEEGIRLFSRIEGDYADILGLPLLPLLNWLTIRGTLAT